MKAFLLVLCGSISTLLLKAVTLFSTHLRGIKTGKHPEKLGINSEKMEEVLNIKTNRYLQGTYLRFTALDIGSEIVATVPPSGAS